MRSCPHIGGFDVELAWCRACGGWVTRDGTVISAEEASARFPDHRAQIAATERAARPDPVRVLGRASAHMLFATGCLLPILVLLVVALVAILQTR